jgi:eukaryotic-like serine/threonine-protein kinase
VPERYLGRTLGKFRIDALIGTGGFAWVYKAWDPELEIPVALKVLKPQYAGDEKFESRFRREAATAAKLRHPNIVKIFAVGKEEDSVFFAMDYLPHGLADRLEVMSTLPESMLIRMGIDVASALGFAHREGVIHRDIKVDNILFDDHGNAIVADFGIARAVTNYVEQTGTNMVVGTPQYFSPEQARGLTLDGRADIYSLGVTLFRASTGELPFKGEDWYEIARQQVEDKPPRPRTINQTISKELEKIVLTCLEKDPDDRFQSGEQLCNALAKLLQERGENVTAVRTLAHPAVETAPSPMRAIPRLKKAQRRLLVRGTAALGALALVGWGTAAFVRSRNSGTAGATPVPPADPGPSATAPVIATATPSAPATVFRVLIVEAPGATILLDGQRVGVDRFQSTTLPAGPHKVTARIAQQANCPSTTVSDSIVLADTGIHTVRLAPRACGAVDLDLGPANARWTLTAAGRPSRTGTALKQAPVPVAAGVVWRLQVQAPACFTYDDTLSVEPRETKRRWVRLQCGER